LLSQFYTSSERRGNSSGLMTIVENFLQLGEQNTNGVNPAFDEVGEKNLCMALT